MAVGPFQIFVQMMNDFDFYGSPFDILSSPVASPKLHLDMSMGIESPSFDLVQVPFALDDDGLVCSQPFVDQEPAVPKFEIQLTRKSAPVTPVKKTAKRSTARVFQPFASFDSVEITVRGLRDAMAASQVRPNVCSGTSIYC